MSSHLSQKEKVAKIAQIYRERNLKLVDWLGDLMIKSSAASLRNYFGFVANLKKVNQAKLTQAVKQIKGLVEDAASGPAMTSGKSLEGAGLKQAMALTRALDDGLAEVASTS